MVEGGVRQQVLAAVTGPEEDLVLSLLCTFGNWFNSSGYGRQHLSRGGSNASSSSSDRVQKQVEIFTHHWKVFLPPPHTRALQACPILVFLAVSLVVPVILARVLTSPQMRQETRYLLLANALLSDLLFVSVYMINTCLNAAGVLMSQWACGALLFLQGVLFSAGILTTKAMVLDTSLAVMCPLRYLALWPVSRTRRAMVGIWAVSMLFPAATVGAFLWHHSTGPCSLHICSLSLFLVLTVSHSTPMQVSMLLTVTGILLILLLVFSGYVALYCRTRVSGVWSGERPSRARGTFLVHYLHLFLSFCPMLVLVIVLLLYARHDVVDLRANLWLSLVVCNVLLVLPKALAPYLYGLRYRDLRRPLLSFYGLKRPSVVTPVM